MISEAGRTLHTLVVIRLCSLQWKWIDQQAQEHGLCDGDMLYIK